MSFLHLISPDFQLTGKNLLVPIVSTGNVSQLAADLLISSLSLHRVGIFDPRYFVPMVGARDDQEPGVTTPMELFGSSSSNILVVQQRSPTLKLLKEQFVESLLNFIQSSKVGSVIFLAGVDQSNRTDAQMLTPTYYIKPPKTPTLASSPLASIADLPIPVYESLASLDLQPASEQQIPFIPSGGLTRRILSSLPPSWLIPTVALLHFVLEGDNRGDAHLLAAVVAKILDVNKLISEWKQPRSWEQGLFGTPQEDSLYG